MKGESGRCDSQNTGTVALFFMSKWTNIGLNIKPLNFMKFNRKEYDLMYDAFQYMEFKMTKEQKDLAQQILDSAYLSNFSSILQEITEWFTRKS